MIKKLFKYFKDSAESTEQFASNEDYSDVFNSPKGKRVILDLMARYQVGKPTFIYDQAGKFNLEASSTSNAAKIIIQDIFYKANTTLEFNSQTSKEEEEPKRSSLSTLPTTATNI